MVWILLSNSLSPLLNKKVAVPQNTSVLNKKIHVKDLEQNSARARVGPYYLSLLSFQTRCGGKSLTMDAVPVEKEYSCIPALVYYVVILHE